MKVKIQIALLTLALLAVGMALGYWLALRRPLPPPDFGGPHHPPGDAAHAAPSPQQVEAFRKQVDALQPQVQAFQERYNAIDADFHAKLAAILTDAQRAQYPPHHGPAIDWTDDFNRLAMVRGGLPPPPLENLPGMRPHQGRALFMLLRILMVEPTLRVMTSRHGLTPDQAARVRPLLEAERDALTTLCQEHPLPLDQLYFSMRDAGLLPEPGSGSEHGPDQPPPPGPQPPHP